LSDKTMMTFRQTLLGIAGAAALALGLAAPASAAVLSVTPTTCIPNPNGSSTTCTVTAGGATATVTGYTGSSAARLITQTFRGESGIGVGVNGVGAPGAEVQATLAERIEITYTALQSFTSIVIAHLYNPDAFGSDPKELARITATDGTTTKVVNLQSLSNLALGYTIDDGSATRVGTNGTVANGVFQGRFELGGLFGGFLFNKLTFQAICVNGAGQPIASCTGDNSDFSIAGVTTSVVPLPAAGLLLLAGLGGLGLVARRRKAA
jgi:hypothetical protein